MIAVGARLTLAEFLTLPETKPGRELICGVVREKPMGSYLHAWFQSLLIEAINALGRKSRRWMAFAEGRGTYSGQSMIPGIAVFRWERITWDAAGLPTRAQAAPPDVIIEIRSDTQVIGDLQARCQHFVENGVDLAFLIVPETRVIWRHSLMKPAPTALTGDQRLGTGEILPGFDPTVAEIFAGDV